MSSQLTFLMYDHDKFSKNDPLGTVRLPIYEMIERNRQDSSWHESEYELQKMDGCPNPTGMLRIATAVQEHMRVVRDGP